MLDTRQFYDVAVGETRFVEWLQALVNGDDVPNIQCEDCIGMQLGVD